MIIIAFLLTGCFLLTKEIRNTNFSFINDRSFTFHSKLDYSRSGILEIEGKEGDQIQIYLLEGRLYRNIILEKDTMTVKLPIGYYYASRNSEDKLMMIIAEDGKTILRK